VVNPHKKGGKKVILAIILTINKKTPIIWAGQKNNCKFRKAGVAGRH